MTSAAWCTSMRLDITSDASRPWGTSRAKHHVQLVEKSLLAAARRSNSSAFAFINASCSGDDIAGARHTTQDRLQPILSVAIAQQDVLTTCLLLATGVSCCESGADDFIDRCSAILHASSKDSPLQAQCALANNASPAPPSDASNGVEVIHVVDEDDSHGETDSDTEEDHSGSHGDVRISKAQFSLDALVEFGVEFD